MNNLEKNNISNKLIETSKILIIHYYKKQHPNYPNLDKEIQRIEDIANKIDFKFVTKKDGQSIRAIHSSEDNSIRYYVDENFDLSDTFLLYSTIPTIIHELQHAISNENKTGALFIEEGIVSYLSADIIRYFLLNPIEIPELDNKQFQNVLENRDLTNAYIYPCEFVSNLNIIMAINNIDMLPEYIFHRNGLQRITELSKTFSDELADILANQHKKDPVFSQNTHREYNYFFSNYDKADSSFEPNLLSDTDILMNQILINSYIHTGNIKKYPLLMERCLNLVDPSQKEKLLNIDSKNTSLSPEEIMQKLTTEMETLKCDYQIYDSPSQTSKQFENIIAIYYNKIKHFPLSYSNALSILIAYDMIQKHQPIDEVQDVCDNYFTLVSPLYADYKILINEVHAYYHNVKELCKKGQSLSDILNNKVYQAYLFKTQLPLPKDITLENFWQQLNLIGKNTYRYLSENDIILYDLFYIYSSNISARYFVEDRVYTQEDYNIFSNKLNKIFENSEYPAFMTHAGKSADFIFIKNCIKYVNSSMEYFPDQIINLLHILKNNVLELGDDVLGNELPSLGENINYAYQKLKKQNSNDKLKEFSSLLNDLCIKDSILFDLTIFTDNPLGKIKYIYDGYLIETLVDLFGRDSLKRYNIIFKDSPDYDR